MNVQDRLLRLAHVPGDDVLIASDIRGRVHKFDADLRLIASSPVPSYDRPVNALCVGGGHIFTKTRFGAVGKWSLDTLEPLDFHDGNWLCDRAMLAPEETASLSPNRGIAYLDGRIYTCNAFNQIVVLDAETFALLDVRQSPAPTFIDCIVAGVGPRDAMSDVAGTLYIGDLRSNDFPVRAQVDTSVVHGVIYDQRHDRFWTTQDGGFGADRFVRTGATTIEPDGSNLREFKLSHEDNEFIAIDPTGTRVYIGGFAGKLAVFDNSGPEFRLLRVIGPLEFQIIHAVVAESDRIYVLLQTGDLIRLNEFGEEQCRAVVRNRCIWIMEPHPADESVVIAGTDQGVAVLEYHATRFGSVQIAQRHHHRFGLGIVKDVKPTDDGSYVGISRKGFVFRATIDGDLLWTRQALGVPRGVALDAAGGRCLIASDDGTLTEMDIADGSIRDRIDIGSPSYGCAYAADGRRVASADRDQCIHIYAADSHRRLGTIDGFRYRIKRMFRSGGELFVAGPDGMFELDLDGFTRRRGFGDHMVSTKENGVVCAGHVHVGGYGYQLASYRYADGAIVDLKETLPDFTKAFCARVGEDGIPILLVGGRGGFICAYRVINGVPHQVREFYVH
ncbi:outer membrane protein assembly factor BamB [Sphingomonas trueperi]|uniref:hypothetical protein n=1 Tax=Sphingomonas trueperi TaxID=53317 RepID=UPI00339267E0